MREIRDHLLETNAKVVRADRSIEATWENARRMFRMRRIVLATSSSVAIMPRQRPLLEYYANSIAHLLPQAAPSPHRMTPAAGVDGSLYRLNEPKKRV